MGNSGKDAFLLSEPHLMIALFSLFKIQKFNKGKDCNLVIEDVACVTVGEKENIDFSTFFFPIVG